MDGRGKMSFLSPLFVLFLITTLIIYYYIPGRVRYVWLLIISLFFYCSLSKESVLYLLGIVFLTYVSGIALTKSNNGIARKCILTISIILILLFLFGTKYISFIIDNINRIIAFVGKGHSLNWNDVVIPIGISYFTLVSIGYLADVYTNKCQSEKNVLKLALFLTFFPIVMAGPIERSDNLLYQINHIPEYDYNIVKNGLLLVIWGYYKKVIIADTISKYVNDMFTNYSNYGSYSIIIATLLFSIMLYADFSGYSDIAVGIGEVFGFELIRNFRQPYFAQGIRDFWRRWHISLSSWLRDYIYIPLGGKQNGEIRKYINIMVVFLISGIWHGSGWTFVIWGLLHGCYQIFEGVYYRLKINKGDIQKCNMFGYKFFRAIVTFVFVSFAWFFFKAESTNAMIDILNHIGRNWDNFEIGISTEEFYLWILLTIPMLIVDIAHEKNISIRRFLEKQPICFRWTCYIVVSTAILIFWLRNWGSEASTFLYAQF